MFPPIQYINGNLLDASPGKSRHPELCLVLRIFQPPGNPSDAGLFHQGLCNYGVLVIGRWFIHFSWRFRFEESVAGSVDPACSFGSLFPEATKYSTITKYLRSLIVELGS